MQIDIIRINDAYKLEGTNETGEKAIVDGTVGIGESKSTFSPMQLLLLSLAGCSAIDVISILKKQRQEIDSFAMRVNGDRDDGVPSPFRKINVHFILSGKIKEAKLARAIELAETKYCSVYFSLNPEIDISYSFDLNSDD